MTQPEITILSTELEPSGVWRVTYDGRKMGDDRGFATKELAQQEIAKRLAKDARDAVTYQRPILLASA